MTHQSESSDIRAEIEALFQEYGVKPRSTLPTTLSVDDFRRVRDLALRIVQGDIDPSEVAEVSEGFGTELSNMVQHLIALRNNPTLRRLEEANPYYDAFSSRIVRDGTAKGGKQ